MALRLLVYLSAFAIAPGCTAAEPDLKVQVDALVAQLVSPNPEPKVRGSATYPPRYDKSTQKAVPSAFIQLQKLGPPAFPYLFEHLEDKRYALTADGGSAMRNWSVGDLCYDAIACQLQTEKPFARGGGNGFRPSPRPWYPGHIELRNAKSANAWYEARKDRTLRELQIEALEWIEAEEAKAPKDYSEIERKEIRDQLQRLRESDKPLEPGVPWSR